MEQIKEYISLIRKEYFLMKGFKEKTEITYNFYYKPFFLICFIITIAFNLFYLHTYLSIDSIINTNDFINYFNSKENLNVNKIGFKELYYLNKEIYLDYNNYSTLIKEKMSYLLYFILGATIISIISSYYFLFRNNEKIEKLRIFIDTTYYNKKISNKNFIFNTIVLHFILIFVFLAKEDSFLGSFNVLTIFIILIDLTVLFLFFTKQDLSYTNKENSFLIDGTFDRSKNEIIELRKKIKNLKINIIESKEILKNSVLVLNDKSFSKVEMEIIKDLLERSKKLKEYEEKNKIKEYKNKKNVINIK